MSRPLPVRLPWWQRTLDSLLRATSARPRRPESDERRSRPRPDLLQSLGGRAE